MENQKLDFGNITIVIYDEKAKPTYDEKRKIVNDLVKVLKSNLEKENYGFKIEFEIISIKDGCIYANIKIWVIASALGTMIANYPNFKQGLRELWSDSKIVFQCIENTTCSAKLHTDSSIKEIYVVKKGDTLYKIASKWKPKHYTTEQFIVALYNENKHAFIKNNINKIKKNSIIKYPRNEFFKHLTHNKAKEILYKLLENK